VSVEEVLNRVAITGAMEIGDYFIVEKFYIKKR